MPYSITTKDGITIRNIPDEVHPDAPELKERVAKIRAETPMQSADQAPAAPPINPMDQMGTLDSIGELVTGRARTTQESQSLPEWTGMPELNSMSFGSFKTALGTLLSNPQETVQIIQANYPDTQVRQDEKGNYVLKSALDGKEYVIPPGVTMGDIPRILGGIAAFTPAGKAATIPGAITANAATQAAIEGTQSATGGEFSGMDVALAGGVAGAVPGVKNAAEAVGGMAGRALGIMPKTQTGDALRQSVRAAEDIGIPVMTSDVKPPETFIGSNARKLGERIPYAGTAGPRANQQLKRIDAVRDTLKEYGSLGLEQSLNDDILAPVAENVLKKRGDMLTKYTDMKKNVFKGVEDAGPVPMPETNKLINDEIDRLANISPEGYAPAISILSRFKNDIAGKRISDIDNNRKLLRSSLADPSLATIKDEAEKSAQKIYSAFNRDLGAFIRDSANPQEFVKWKVANAQLADLAGELQNTSFKTVLKKADMTPETVSKMLYSAQPSTIRTLYNDLEDVGRSHARAAILASAAKKAEFMQPDGVTAFSPDKFKNELARLKPSIDVFFRGKDALRLEGLSRALEITKRAGQAGVSTATGQEAMPFVAGGFLATVLGGPLQALAGAATIGMAARGYESAPIRNLLIDLARTKPMSQAEKKVLAKIQTIAQGIRQTQSNAEEK